MKTTTENSGKKRPRVIAADIQVEYTTGDKKKEKHSMVFTKDFITIWDDLITIPQEITAELFNRFEKRIRRTKSQELSIDKIIVIDFHGDYGPVNYEPVGGWIQI